MATTPFNPGPVSAGKLKQLWDAIRQAPSGAPGDAPSAPPTAPGAGGSTLPSVLAQAPPAAVTKIQKASQGAGPVALPNGSPANPDDSLSDIRAQAPPPAHMSGPPPDVASLEPGADPDVVAASPKFNDLPSNSRVQKLQSQLDAKPSLTRRILQGALPVAAAGLAAAFHAPSAVQGIPTAEQTARDQSNLNRKNLTDQLSAATSEREREYDEAQRASELTNANIQTNRTRQQVAQILAGSRSDVAQTTADSRRDVAGTAADSRRDVATTGANARLGVADVSSRAARYRADQSASASRYGADRRVEASKYAADAALNRQQLGFNHTDEKPTADEDRRADLTDAFKGYATDLRDIAARRPDLFGPLSGRVGHARAVLGSDDPDIQAIQRIKEQLGTVSLGAHSLRNAGHIETAANSIANQNQGADSLIQNIDGAVKGVDQFNTIHRPTLAGKVNAASPRTSAPKPKSGSANDPLGIR